MKAITNSKIFAGFTLLWIWVSVNCIYAQDRKWDYYGYPVSLRKIGVQEIIQQVRLGPEDTGIWGVIRGSRDYKQVVVEPKYNYIFDFDEYGYACVKLDNKYGYIDWTGKEITPIKYDKIGWYQKNFMFQNNRARVRIGGKYGYIDRTGKEIIPLDYPYATSFSETDPFAFVYVGTTVIDDHTLRPKFWDNLMCGMIDSIGRYIIKPTKYKDLYWGIGNRIIAERSDKAYDLLDINGKVVKSTNYNSIDNVDERYYKVASLKGARYQDYGITDTDMNIIIPPKYGLIQEFIFDDRVIIYRASYNSDIFFLTEKGNLLTSKKYKHSDPAKGGFVRSSYYWAWVLRLHVVVNQDNLYGFINREGEEVIPCKFFVAEDFSPITKLAIVVNKDKKYGVIDTTGKLIIPFIYDALYNAWKEGDHIRAYLESRLIELDYKGNEI